MNPYGLPEGTYSNPFAPPRTIENDEMTNNLILRKSLRETLIVTSVVRLNHLFSKSSKYNMFDICEVRKIVEGFGNEWYGTFQYDFLSSFHCVRWSEISDEVRVAITTAIISLINESRIAFDTNSMKFIDTGDDSSRVTITPKKYTLWDKIKGYFGF